MCMGIVYHLFSNLTEIAPPRDIQGNEDDPGSSSRGVNVS